MCISLSSGDVFVALTPISKLLCPPKEEFRFHLRNVGRT